MRTRMETLSQILNNKAFQIIIILVLIFFIGFIGQPLEEISMLGLTVKFGDAKGESGDELAQNDKEEIAKTLFEYGLVKIDGYNQLNINAWEKILINPALEHKKRGTCRFIKMKRYYDFGERVIDIREINFKTPSFVQVIARVGEEKVLRDMNTKKVIKKTPYETDQVIYNLERKDDKWYISCLKIWMPGEYKNCSMSPLSGSSCT